MFTSGFFNSVSSDRKYNAEQMSAIFDGLINDGIFDSIGDHFQVTPAASGLGVSVGTGRAWLNSTWSYNDSAYPITLSAASASLGRKDLICLKVDKSTNVRANSIVCITGTPASTPVEPTVSDDAINEIYYHKLAAVLVSAGATSITSADITNYIGLSTGTPYVTGIIDSTSVDELWSQWDGEFNAWWEDVKTIIDEDTAAQLSNRIDHITPKESTMNLYGFTHINPPASSDYTYQAYSTDAILNQISSLLNSKSSIQYAQTSGYSEFTNAEYELIYISPSWTRSSFAAQHNKMAAVALKVVADLPPMVEAIHEICTKSNPFAVFSINNRVNGWPKVMADSYSDGFTGLEELAYKASLLNNTIRNAEPTYGQYQVSGEPPTYYCWKYGTSTDKNVESTWTIPLWSSFQEYRDDYKYYVTNLYKNDFQINISELIEDGYSIFCKSPRFTEVYSSAGIFYAVSTGDFVAFDFVHNKFMSIRCETVSEPSNTSYSTPADWYQSSASSNTKNASLNPALFKSSAGFIFLE